MLELMKSGLFLTPKYFMPLIRDNYVPIYKI